MAKPQLEAAGFKVDLQSMDWQTLVGAPHQEGPAERLGRLERLLHLVGLAVDMHRIRWRPPSSTRRATRRRSAGRAIEGLEKLRDAYAKETDPAKQKEIAAQVQARAAEYPTHAPLGQFTTPTAVGRKASGLLPSPALALWNVEKR